MMVSKGQHVGVKDRRLELGGGFGGCVQAVIEEPGCNDYFYTRAADDEYSDSAGCACGAETCAVTNSGHA